MKILPAKAGEGERRAVAFPLPSSLALFSGPPLSKSPCGNRGTVSSRACTRVLVPTNSNLRPVSRASCYLRRLFLYVSRNYDYYRIYTSFPLYTIFRDVSLELSSKRQASYYILEHYLDFISEILERRKATKYHPTHTHARAYRRQIHISWFSERFNPRSCSRFRRDRSFQARGTRKLRGVYAYAIEGVSVDRSIGLSVDPPSPRCGLLVAAMYHTAPHGYPRSGPCNIKC